MKRRIVAYIIQNDHGLHLEVTANELRFSEFKDLMFVSRFLRRLDGPSPRLRKSRSARGGKRGGK